MHPPTLYKKSTGIVNNSNLLLWSYATVFYPRLLSSFGAPSPINFAHFIIIPVTTGFILLTSPIRDRGMKKIAQELSVGIGIFLAIMLASALLNQAGLVNAFIYLMILVEPFIFLLAFAVMPLGGKTLNRFRAWILIFALSNLFLALAQSVLLPIGLYPRPDGGTLQDNITGVFGGGGGSAGNYISCTVSIYVGIYIFNRFKAWPIWLRSSIFILGVVQAQVSDSKQVFLALLGGWILLSLSKVDKPAKFILYLILSLGLTAFLYWVILNTDFEFLSAYRNWLAREGIFGPDGEATRTKLAAFRIIPTHFDFILDWLFGLGPGHGVSRVGGWVLRDYARLLMPLGATVHPASAEVFQVVSDGWIAKESTIYFPLFTWAGIWSEVGIVGLLGYLYLCTIVWKRFCVDDFCRFLLLSTVVFGFILTQMEEPGQVVTVAMLIGLRWHEVRTERQTLTTLAPQTKAQVSDPFEILKS